LTFWNTHERCIQLCGFKSDLTKWEEINTMKRIAIGAVASMLLLGAGVTLAKDHTFTGEVYDSQCAKNGSHAMMLAKEGMAGKENDPMGRAMCTKNCVKMGGKYVLFDAAKKTVYELDDQTKPAEFAGQKVKVTGTFDKATKTIHVTSIQAAS
jgi:copper(I)-binding protein